MNQDRLSKSPGVFIPPPLFFVAGFGLGWLCDRVWPLPLVQDPLPTLLTRTLLFAGAALFVLGFVRFARHQTPISPAFGARVLITDGPFRLSRNPIYLGFCLIYFAGVVRSNNLWTLLIFPLVFLVIDRYLIPREERHLRAVFGDSYISYCQRVRRWL